MTLESPLLIVLNKASGNRDANEAEVTIRNVLEQAGRRYDLAIVNHARRLPILAKRAVELAQQQHGAVIEAGGDGALNTVAKMVLKSGRPFGVLPLGTFNYFGRAHGIPEDTAKAAQVLLDAAIKLAMDGEVIWLRTPLTFEIAPRPLPLLAPANSPEDVDGDSA